MKVLSINRETNDPKGCEWDSTHIMSVNGPAVLPTKENGEKSCDLSLKPKIINVGVAEEEDETKNILSPRHRPANNSTSNDLSSDEKSIALEERQLAYEERKLAIQEKKMAIEEKKLLLESRKIALLKEKQNIVNKCVNQCDQSDTVDGPLRERTTGNVFEVLMSVKQQSTVTSTTEHLINKEMHKELEDVDAKIKSRVTKKIVKTRLEELTEKKISKKKRLPDSDGECLKIEIPLKKKRILLVSDSDDESITQQQANAMEGDQIIISHNDVLPVSTHALKTKSPKSMGEESAEMKKLILISEEDLNDVVLMEHPKETKKSCKKLSLKQSKLKLKSDRPTECDVVSTPPSIDKKRNNLFNYFNSTQKAKEVPTSPEGSSELTNNVITPADSEDKSVDEDVMAQCAEKSMFDLQPAIVLQQLDLESIKKKEKRKKVKTPKTLGGLSKCNKCPRQNASTPSKSDSDTNHSSLPNQEKADTKPNSSRKPWQMRIMPTSPNTVMDLFKKVSADDEDLVIDDYSDSDELLFPSKKTQHEKEPSKKVTNKPPPIEGHSSPIVAKKSKLQLNKTKKTKEVACLTSKSPSDSVKTKTKKKIKEKEHDRTKVTDSNSKKSETIQEMKNVIKDDVQIVDSKSTSKLNTETSKNAVKKKKDPAQPSSKERPSPIVAKKIKNSKTEQCSTSTSRTRLERTSKDNANSRIKLSEKTTIDMDDDIEVVDVTIVPSVTKKHQTPKASVKLAPLFMKKKDPPKEIKPAIDALVLEARQRFLKSGVPDCVKKITEIIFRDEPEEIVFPMMGTSHVTQSDGSDVWHLPKSDLKLSPCAHEQPSPFKKSVPLGTLIINTNSSESSILNRPSRPVPISSLLCRTIVKSLKLENPHFPYPMYRMFKLLRDKNLKLQQNDSSLSVDKDKKQKTTPRCNTSKRKRIISDSDEETKRESAVSDNRFQMWTEKYKPLSGDEIIGNKICVRQLKLWLESWKKFRNCDNPKTLGKKKKRSANSCSEDEFINDSSGDDNNEDMPGNTAILYGPHGCGKTAIVYALANELGFEILESNTSTKRTGKCLLAEFQGATQIHRLCSQGEQSGGVDKFLKSGKPKKKHAQKVKPLEKDRNANSKMSIVLIDDADIVFEDHDEGFISALATLVNTSRRPIIFIANNSETPHLARFFEDSLVLDLVKPDIRHTSIWLQLICLVEGIRASKDGIQRLLKFYNGDVTRSLLQLQFWALSGGNNLPKVVESVNTMKNRILSDKIDVEDNDSSSSWVDSQESSDDIDLIPVHNECIEMFFDKKVNLCTFPVNLSGLWWNLAPMLSLSEMKPNRPIVVKQSETSEPPKELYEQLQAEYLATDEEGSPVKQNSTVTEVNEKMDTDVSEKCTMNRSETSMLSGVSSVSTSHSHCSLSEMQVFTRLMDNLSAMDVLASNPRLNGDSYDVGPCQRVWEREAVDGVSVRENYRPCWNYDEYVSQSVVHYVTEGSIQRCRQTMQTFGASEMRTGYNAILPTEEVIRWRYDQQSADNTIIDLILLGQLLDHRAIFTEYVPLLQSICSHEMSRFERNTTRLNRFFHYLKGLGIHASDTTLNILASSFKSGLWQNGK